MGDRMVGMCRLTSAKYVGAGCHGEIRELLGLGDEVEGEEEKPREISPRGTSSMRLFRIPVFPVSCFSVVIYYAG